MFRKREQKIDDIMRSMMKENTRFSNGLQKQNIASIWSAVLGSTIAHYTSSIRLDKKTLYVKISSAPLRNELIYEKEKLIAKLNQELVHRKIDELVIR